MVDNKTNLEEKRISNGMKIPHSVEGLVLAPVFASTVFLLKLSCPVKTGEGCFADIFFKIVFLPLPFLYKIFSSNPVWIARHEALVLLTYWAVIGFLIGLLVDVHRKVA
jgi:hypothetical protein